LKIKRKLNTFIKKEVKTKNNTLPLKIFEVYKCFNSYFPDNIFMYEKNMFNKKQKNELKRIFKQICTNEEEGFKYSYSHWAEYVEVD